MLAPITHFQPVVQGSMAPRPASPQEATQSSTSTIEDKSEIVKTEASKLTKKATEELSKAEQATVQRLKNRDQEVKAHEQAHLSAAGTLAVSGASFTYTTGPNGVKYATGGEVNIDTAPVEGDPAATLNKADTIRRAALAPASPSSQDLLVANKATTMAQTARTELIQQKESENPLKTAQSKEDNKTTEQEQPIEAAEGNGDRETADFTIDLMV